MAKSKAIVVKDKVYSIQSITQMTEMAKVLKNHIVGNKLYTTIVGKNYAHVEGWTFAGGLMGIFPKVVSVENISTTDEKKWLAKVELVNVQNNLVVGQGFAICSNKENNKKNFDEYAVMSMAQTRAIGKAYRNLIGWVMKLSGYEATPSEEMTNVQEKTANGNETVYRNAIKQAKDNDTLFKIKEQIDNSGTLSAEVKKKLNGIISTKVDVNDSQN